MTTTHTDRIEKKILLYASRSRVWRALTNAEEFGTWFRVKFDGEFAESATVRGKLTYPGYEHMTMEVTIERMVPEQLFSYRWHPYAVKPDIDYTAESPTLVEFSLKETEGGTLLTVVESGFDKLPSARRAEAFRMNDNGWTQQMTNIERYLAPA